METVASFRYPWEAHMLRLRLEAEGIPATLASQHHIANNWLYSQALGGVRVQVPRSWLRQAHAVETNARAGVFQEELRAEYEDMDDAKYPRCGSSQFGKFRPAAAVLLSSLSFPFVGIPAIGWSYDCKACGATWTCRQTGNRLIYWTGFVLVSGTAIGLLALAAHNAFWH